MMTCNVLVQEVGVAALGVWNDSNNLIVPFPSVDELMTTNFVYSIEVGPLEAE